MGVNIFFGINLGKKYSAKGLPKIEINTIIRTNYC